MEKKKQCCTPKGQIKRYVDCVGCDKKPMDIMSDKKQSSIEWLIEQMIKFELIPKGIHFDNILFHQAKAMHKEEIAHAYNYISLDETYQPIPAEHYYKKRFGGQDNE